MNKPATAHRVLVAGGGVAGLEAVIALHHLAGDRVDVTLVAPSDEFTIKALSVNEPFGRPASAAYDVELICADHGAAYRHDAIHTVHPGHRSVVLRSGTDMHYEALLVAIGARPRVVYPAATTFRGAYDADLVAGLLRDVDLGAVSRIAFLVPPGTTWPLPLYELALMTAEHVESRGGSVELTIVTPEPAPLGIFGAAASVEVARLLAEHDIAIHADAQVRSIDGHLVTAAPGDVEVETDAIVAVPLLTGPGLRGLPRDDHGFLPVADDGRVVGVAGVFGAGDGTTIPIKQGGIAAQQADAAVRSIAIGAGAPLEPRPFRPTLRGQLLTGSRSRYLREAMAGCAGARSSVASDHALWWPPAKVAAPYLAPYLERLDAGLHGAAPESAHRSIHAPGDPSGGLEVLG